MIGFQRDMLRRSGAAEERRRYEYDINLAESGKMLARSRGCRIEASK